MVQDSEEGSQEFENYFLLTFRQFEKVLLGIFICLFLSLVFVLLCDPENSYKVERFAPFAILLAAILATYGWITGSRTSIQNRKKQEASQENLQRKQHTLNVLLSFRESKLMADHRARILDHFSSEKPMSQEYYELLKVECKNHIRCEKNGSVNWHILESVTALANYYEFISAGINSKDLDKNLMEDTLRGLMVRYYIIVYPFIKASMDGDPKAFEHFTKIFKEWQQPHEKLPDISASDEKNGS